MFVILWWQYCCQASAAVTESAWKEPLYKLAKKTLRKNSVCFFADALEVIKLSVVLLA